MLFRSLFFWLQKKRGKLRPADGSVEEDCGAQNESKRYTLSPIQPLSHRWFLIKGIKALVCPFAVLRSCFGYSLSHLRTAAACLSRCILHRRRSEFLPLHRGAEIRSANVRSNLYTVEPRFTLQTPAATLNTGESRTHIITYPHRPRHYALS